MSPHKKTKNQKNKTQEKEEVKPFAIIKTGGKQYLVRSGNVVQIEKLSDKKPGDKVEFDRVLLVQPKKGDPKIGQPFLDEVSVTGEVLEHGQQDKVVVFKYKPKKRSRRKQGHRQSYTAVEITNIED